MPGQPKRPRNASGPSQVQFHETTGPRTRSCSSGRTGRSRSARAAGPLVQVAGVDVRADRPRSSSSCPARGRRRRPRRSQSPGLGQSRATGRTVALSEVTWLQKRTRVRSRHVGEMASTSSSGSVARAARATRTTAPVTRAISSQSIAMAPYSWLVVTISSPGPSSSERATALRAVVVLGTSPRSSGSAWTSAPTASDRRRGARRAAGRGRGRARPRARAGGAPAPRIPAAARRRMSRG